MHLEVVFKTSLASKLIVDQIKQPGATVEYYKSMIESMLNAKENADN